MPVFTQTRLVYRNIKGRRTTAPAHKVIDDYRPSEEAGWLKRGIVSVPTEEQLALDAFRKGKIVEEVVADSETAIETEVTEKPAKRSRSRSVAE